MFVTPTNRTDHRRQPVTESGVGRTFVVKLSSRRLRNVVLLIWMVPWLFCLGCQGGPRPPATPPGLPTSAAGAGGTTIVAVAAPSPPQMTLPQFLGLGQLFGGIRAIGQRIRSRLGSRFPGLEPKPPLLPITDPANMSEDASPAVKAAAEAKAEEDKAPQKAKAIRYLASLGCGKCYPDTEDALLAALEDCTELIRYETVKGLRDSVGNPCQCCRENSCCSPKLLEKLHQLAYEVLPNGCYYEPSARVRRYARLVIRGCGGVQTTDFAPGLPQEGPTAAPAEPTPAEPTVAKQVEPAAGSGVAPVSGTETPSAQIDVRPASEAAVDGQGKIGVKPASEAAIAPETESQSEPASADNAKPSAGGEESPPAGNVQKPEATGTKAAADTAASVDTVTTAPLTTNRSPLPVTNEPIESGLSVPSGQALPVKPEHNVTRRF